MTGMMRAFLASALMLLVAACSYCQVGTAPAGTVRVVNEVTFTGNTIVPSNDLASLSNMKSGDLITSARIERAAEAIQQAYRKRGYLAVVRPDFSGFESSGNLTFAIVEVRVSDVKIEGLHKTRELVVRRMLELKPGDLYYVPALSRDADRIISLGIFDSVDANPEPNEEAGTVVIVWKLVEKAKTGDVRLGGSYSPSDHLILDVTYTENNLRGRAEQLGVTANIGTLKGRFGGEVFYTNPWSAPNRSLSLRAYDSFRYRLSQNLTPTSGRYLERTAGGQVSTTRTISQVAKFTLGTRFESVTVEGLPLDLMTTSIPSASGRVAAVSGTLAVDKRDSSVYPTTGQLWRVGIEPAWTDPTDESATWIAKATGQLQRYCSLGPASSLTAGYRPTHRPSVIAGRLIAGTSAGRLPFFEQYFIGGVNGPRGYTEARFWGKNMLLATAEYRNPVTGRLVLVGFVDAGDAWGSRFRFLPGTATDFGQDKSFKPHAGAGAGIRYQTPYGPLGLDFAWGEGFHTHLVLGPVF